MKNGILFLLAISWSAWWLTPDQQGWRYFQRGKFEEAAAAFQDPLWSGTAWYRAGEFEKAAQQFARRDSAEAYFNQGNSQLLLGKYDAAITCYDRALQKRAQWSEAIEFSLMQPYPHNHLFLPIHLFQIMKLDNLSYTEKDYVESPYLDPTREFLLEFFCGELEQLP